MMKTVSTACAVLALALSIVATSAAQAQIRPSIGGIGAPQAVNCEGMGGTMNGAMCDLPSGRSCEAMAFARDGLCYDANGVLVPEAVLEERTGPEEGDPGEKPTAG